MKEIICDVSFIPYLKKMGCTVENNNGTRLYTDNPEAAQAEVTRLMPGYKLMFV